MADEIDQAQELEHTQREYAIAAARKEIPKGEPGECEWCEKHTPRLIGGACVSCRDKHKLP